MSAVKNCIVCGKEFSYQRKTMKYCSNACKCNCYQFRKKAINEKDIYSMDRIQAKLSIIFYYEKITGCNLYGFLPDRSIWHTPEYKKAVLKARMNLTGNGNEAAAEYLKEFSL